MTSRRCCRRARSSTSWRGTTTRRTTRRIQIPINGSAGAIAPSTRWATRGSISRTTTTRTSKRSSRSGPSRQRRRLPDSSSNKKGQHEIFRKRRPKSGRRSFFWITERGGNARRCVDRRDPGWGRRERKGHGRRTTRHRPDAKRAAAVADDSRARLERDRRLRRLVLRQGRQHIRAGRLFQSQYQAGVRYSDRAEQPDRAGRARSGAADAFSPRTSMGRLHRQAAEGSRQQEADLDDRRQRIYQRHHPPHTGRLHRRTVRGRGEQEHAAEVEVRSQRHDRGRRANRRGGEVQRGRRHTADADGMGDGRGRGRGSDAEPQGRGASGDATAGRGRGGGFFNPPLAVTWSWLRGPAAPKFDNLKPSIDTNDGGKTTTTVTFSEPGEYLLRVEGNDSTGAGGGGFQCCWTTAHVAVSVKAAPTR